MGLFNGQKPRCWRSEAGDTIVEVLICIMIISTVLTGAFVTTSRSQHGIRNSQEHAEALQLIESQLEQLRANARRSNSDVFGTAQPFCMHSTSANGPTPLYAVHQAKCVLDSGGDPTTGEPAYKIGITRSSGGVSSDGWLFTVHVHWDSVTGQGQEKEQMVYRLYQ
jgi:type II secretory pathway pseudopilin PulG